VQITSDIELSGAGCTTAITPNQLVQSSSENDNAGERARNDRFCSRARWRSIKTASIHVSYVHKYANMRTSALPSWKIGKHAGDSHSV
jgi:hypothetical protein